MGHGVEFDVYTGSRVDALGQRMIDEHGPSERACLGQTVAEQAKIRPTAPFLEDARSHRRVTYADLNEEVHGYQYALRSVEPGARIVIDVADPLRFATAYLGVIATGRSAVPVNPQAPVAELNRCVETVAPAGAVTDQPERSADLGLPVIANGIVATLANGQQASRPHAANGAATATATYGSALLLTSGSTAAPKAVELSQRQLLHVADCVAQHHELSPADRGYNSLPLFHINAEVVGLLATLRRGATLVVDERFRKSGFWELLAERDITWVNAVPAILTILADRPVTVRPPRLRFLRSASAPLPVSVGEQIHTAVGVPVVESYGMTEAASQITATPLDGSAPPGSCGRPVGAQLRVRDNAGADLPPGRVGHVWIRGAGVITGYVGGRAAERFDDDGWLQTGDLGRVDDDGFLFLVARADDVINRGGEMLYPREIEEALLADPAVQEVVVTPQEHSVLGQVPVAHVLPASNEPPDALVERLTNECAAQLSRPKRPEEIHLVAQLPRASTGKVQRYRLRDSPALAP